MPCLAWCHPLSDIESKVLESKDLEPMPLKGLVSERLLAWGKEPEWRTWR